MTLAGGLLALGLAGCSSDSSTDSGASTPTPSATTTPSATDAVCADAAEVRTSLDALVSTEVLREGTDTLKERFATFEASVRQLIDGARVEFAPQSDAARASVDDLKAALAGLADSPSVQDAAAIATSLAAVKTSVTALLDAVQAAC